MVNFSQPESMRENLLPGSLVFTGEQKMEKPRIRVFDYAKDRLEEKEVDDIRDAFPYLARESVTWINVDGLHDVGLIQAIRERLNIHPLVLEDILNTGSRPKAESHDGYLFIVVKSIGLNREATNLDLEQMSFVVGPNYVLSFQERPGDFFESVRERLRGSKGRIRTRGADYLAYALIDAIVDNYYKIPEHFSRQIEAIETSVLSDPTPKDLEAIYNLKREIVVFDRAVWPLIEVVGNLRKDESGLIAEDTGPFLGDLYDHVEHLNGTLQSTRDMASNLHDLYLSTVSNSMNEVMKVLAVIATIFIPLTFLAGIFGMNFEFMPELKVKYAYYTTLAVMVVIGVAMAIYFKRKKWF